MIGYQRADRSGKATFFASSIEVDGFGEMVHILMASKLARRQLRVSLTAL